MKPLQHWCRWTSTFFLLTLYSSLKNFLSGISNAIFFSSTFFNVFFWRKWTLGRALSARWTPSSVFLRQAAAFFLSFWNFSPREVRDHYFWLKPPFKEFRTRVEEHWRVHWQDSRSLPLSLACTFYLLDEFLQGTHLSIILTGTGVARWRWASKVF